MPQDSAYRSISYIYKSRGLIARYTIDQTPEFYYLDLLNFFEIAENAIAPRYGTQIINRDPDGTESGSNYLFDFPVTTLAKLTYLAQPYRYAITSDGQVWVRASNLQGAYTSIHTGLSGQPAQYVITNCFQTSQPYIFFYDQAASIKTSGSGTPSLTGLDPSGTTATALPFSPLLTLIDNFGPSNFYNSSGFSVAWASESITTLTAGSLYFPTDFPEYIGVANSASGYTGGTYPLSGGNLGMDLGTSVTGTGISTYTTPPFLGFPSITLPLTSNITLAVTLSAKLLLYYALDFALCTGVVNFQYSIDGGTSWATFYTYAASRATVTSPTGNPAPVGPILISTPVSGLTNLANLEVRFTMTLTAQKSEVNPNSTLAGNIASISATTNNSAAADPFDGVVDGMLAVFNNTSLPSPVPIVNVTSAVLNGGVYNSLIIMTAQPHGYSTGYNAAIYGSSSSLVDGFYFAITVNSSNQFTVNLANIDPTVSFLSATGGVCYAGPGANTTNPSTCVIANHYSTPYPSQFSAWGFTRPLRGIAPETFPIYCWVGTVAQNTTSTSPALVGNTIALDLSFNNQVTDDDLIVITLLVDNPAAIDNIRLQFDVRGSQYTSSYYYKDIAPAYYQQSVQNLEDAYTATEQQILAGTLGITTPATPNSTTAQLQPGNFSTGSGAWATVYLRRGDFVPVGTAGQPGLDWSAITGWQLVITTNTVGAATVAVNGLYLQWGYGPSSFAGIGYDYRYTPYNINTGTEGNPSPEQKFSEQYGWLASLTAPIFLRQAVQITGTFFADPQVTHIRIYRRGGIVAANWFQIDQIPNIPGGGVDGSGQFIYKDVISDDALLQGYPLVLDNDPPVTSSLSNPLLTTLATAPSSPGQSIYSIFTPQLIKVQASSFEFVPTQVITIGTANNLEVVNVISGGTGQFTAILRLQHNIGENLYCYSLPRVSCNLCALAYGQVWLTGDKNNPHYLYFSKASLPENFGPQNYMPVGSPNYPITIVVNWRGTLFVATTQTWWIIPGAAARPQPTGSIHGAVSSQGWTQTEGGIMYQASDGLREFQGADGAYLTLPVEFLYRNTALTPVPLVDLTQLSSVVMAYYNNWVFTSYISQNSGQRYRLICDLVNNRRFHYDDIAATAMLWEQDTNQLIVGKPIYFENDLYGYAVVQDQVTSLGSDDLGYFGGVLQQMPIYCSVEMPYTDLNAPHYPKQWNVVEVDVVTQNQSLTTELLLDTEPPSSVTLNPINTGAMRSKEQLNVNSGDGTQAYSASIKHTISSSVLGVMLFQDNIYATQLADYRQSLDSYWIKFDYEQSKIVKQGYFDYTSTADITVNLYVGGIMDHPYYSFTLPAEPQRRVVRELFPAWKPRLWRMVMTSDADFQIWRAPQIEWKPVREGSGFAIYEVKM
jgi:hypothetical protein